MDDSTYQAILDYHDGNDDRVKAYLRRHYSLDRNTAWSASDRLRREYSRFATKANKYRPVGEELMRIKDGFTVVRESDVPETLGNIQDDVYGGRDKLFYEVKKRKYEISQRRILRWLKGDDVTASFRPAKKESVVRPILSSKPNERWQIDITYMSSSYTEPDLPSVNEGFRYICTIVDHFTKRVWLAALRESSTDAVVDVLVDAIESEMLEGRDPPSLVQSDNSRVLISAIDRLSNAYPLKRITSSSYSSKSQGLVERVHREVKRILGMKMKEYNTNYWIEHLEDVQEVINTRYQATIGMSPNEALNRTPQVKAAIKSGAKRMSKRNGPRTAPLKKGDRVRIAIKAVNERLRKTKSVVGQPVWSDEALTVVKTRGYLYQLVNDDGSPFAYPGGRVAWINHSEVMKV